MIITTLSKFILHAIIAVVLFGSIACFAQAILYSSYSVGGGRVVRRCWVNFQCRGVLPIKIIVGQGPIALAVRAGGGVWTFFLSSIFSLFFLPLRETPDID